jgi:DNA-binding transcriptional LysR family regulator
MASSTRHSYKEVSLAQLRSFCEVCQRGGYAAAARELFLTSAAVWKQMQALERHYGVPLLERHGGGVQPTRQGRWLLGTMQRLLAELDSSREVLQQQDGAVPEQINLVTNLRVLAEVISQALGQFRRRYPGVRLRLLYTGIRDVEPRVLQGEADLAFTLEPGPDIPSAQAIVYEPAGEVDYLLILPPRHPLQRQRALHLRHIVRYPLVLGTSELYSRRRVQEILHRHHLAHAMVISVETSSDEYTLSCVRAGLGLGITVGVPRGHLYLGLGVRSLGRWFGAARVGFLWKRGTLVPPVQRELAQTIRSCVATGGRGG